MAHPEPDLDNLFTHHPPFGDQVERYQELRSAAHTFALLVMAHVPPSPERSTALRKIREGVMWANAGIACNETPPVDPEVCTCAEGRSCPVHMRGTPPE